MATLVARGARPSEVFAAATDEVGHVLSTEVTWLIRYLPGPTAVSTAYYVVSEALTNAAKHANATAVHVDVDATHNAVRLAVRDDGVGGADPASGSGLLGLYDRVEAVGGTITIHRPIGEGTELLAELPLQPVPAPD